MFCPCISVQVACTGVRTATTLRLARPTGRGCTCVPCFFVFGPERGAEKQTTNPETMLRPYIPDTNTFYSADPRSVRVCAPSFARTGTPAVDNNPASKAPESGNGGPFPEVGAEHLNSSRRSCVTCISLGGSAPVFKVRNFNYIIAKITVNPVSEGFICPPPHNPVRRSFAARLSVFRRSTTRNRIHRIP